MENISNLLRIACPKNIEILSFELFYSGDWFIVLKDKRTGLKGVAKPERPKMNMSLSIKQEKSFTKKEVEKVKEKLFLTGCGLFQIYTSWIKTKTGTNIFREKPRPHQILMNAHVALEKSTRMMQADLFAHILMLEPDFDEQKLRKIAACKGVTKSEMGYFIEHVKKIIKNKSLLEIFYLPRFY